MGIVLNILTKLIPFLGPLIERFTGKDSDKERELKAERELEEMRAFKKGRITPKFLLKYCLIFLFMAFSILFIIALFFPGIISMPELDPIRDLIHMGNTLTE